MWRTPTAEEELQRQVEKLQKFKDWVHAYLDAKGVPTHIQGPHSKEGCRIGDRMDWVFDRLGDDFGEDADEDPGDGWQPIETAPKDGTAVLLCCDGLIVIGEFSRGYWIGARLREPSHWQPLPLTPPE